MEVANNDTTSTSTPAAAQFQLSLSGMYIKYLSYESTFILYHHNMDTDRLNDRPTNKELRDHIQKKIGDKWEELGIELGLDDDDNDDDNGDTKTTLDGIRERWKDNINMAAYHVLNSWLKDKRTKPTWGRLIEALRGAGLNEVAESVTTYLSASCKCIHC